MKPLFRILLPLFALNLVSGCLYVDYFGQSFEPTPETSPVEYYTSREDIPAGKYRIIGRGTITTERRIDGYDIREALVDAARKHGADAVAAVSVTRKQVGLYPQENYVPDAPATAPNRFGGIAPDSVQSDIDSFKSAELRGEAAFRTEVHVRALFLKDKAALEQIFARRGKELDDLVKQPEPKDVGSLTEKPQAPEQTSIDEVKITRNPKP